MQTTIKGICLNLNESNYSYKFKDLIFYFSSVFYKKKFIENVQNYIETETLKFQAKYNININLDIIFMISLYKKIEKRGFRIYDDKNKKEITPNCGIISTILMY